MEIYKHINRRFEEHLMRLNSDFGHHRMKDQLRLLKDAKNKLKQRCVIQQVGNDKLFGEFYDPSTNDIMGYAIKQYVHIFIVKVLNVLLIAACCQNNNL